MKTVHKQKKVSLFQIKPIITALFNKNISNKKKVMAVGIVLYIISPIDFIPDFIPLAGYADDVILPILLLFTNKLLSDDTSLTRNYPPKEAEKLSN